MTAIGLRYTPAGVCARFEGHWRPMAALPRDAYVQALAGETQFGVPDRWQTLMGRVRRERAPLVPEEEGVAEYERRIYEQLCAGLVGTKHAQYALLLQSEAQLFGKLPLNIIHDRLYCVLYRHFPAPWLPLGHVRDAVLAHWQRSVEWAQACRTVRPTDGYTELVERQRLRLDQPTGRQRNAYRVLCNQVGLPVAGLPSLREMSLLRTLLHAANIPAAPDYLSMQAALRDMMDVGAPMLMQAIACADHEVLAAVVEAYWGPVYCRRMPTMDAALRVVEAFGNAGYFPEIGLHGRWNREERIWQYVLVRGDGAQLDGTPFGATIAHTHFAIPSTVGDYVQWSLASAPLLTAHGWGGRQQWPLFFSGGDIASEIICALGIEIMLNSGECTPAPHRRMVRGVPTYTSWVVNPLGISCMQLSVPLDIRIDIGLREITAPDAALRHQIERVESAYTGQSCKIRVVPFAEVQGLWEEATACSP